MLTKIDYDKYTDIEHLRAVAKDQQNNMFAYTLQRCPECGNDFLSAKGAELYDEVLTYRQFCVDLAKIVNLDISAEEKYNRIKELKIPYKG